MKIVTQLKFYVVLVSISFIGLMVNYFKVKNQLDKCETDKYYLSGGDIEKSQLIDRVDSLKEELYIRDIEVGSYELMWSILEDINKPLADSINLQVE
jgi:hypothetical protein